MKNIYISTSDYKNDEADDWTFKGCNTQYFTHSFHSYPAKFIPQLAKKLIIQYSKENDIVSDIFCGSGTTLVESLLNKRYSIGIDVNPIACLISKCKTLNIYPLYLLKEIMMVLNIYSQYLKDEEMCNEICHKELSTKNSERIYYWHPPKRVKDLSVLLHIIKYKVKDPRVKIFLLTCFSDILKTLSRWLDWSIKPQRDCRPYNKDSDKRRRLIPNVKYVFEKKILKMWKIYNKSFDTINYNYIPELYNCSNKNIGISNNSIDLVITSPPYLTSYEYADLHQLSALWLNEIQLLSEFRKGFIGSKTFDKKIHLEVNSDTANYIINNYLKGKAKDEAKNYFTDMYDSFSEMHRIMKNKSKAAIVIGNSFFKGKEINNKDIFIEQFTNLNFEILEIFQRKIPTRRLTSFRDIKTGRIVSNKELKNSIEIYPIEYIIIIQK